MKSHVSMEQHQCPVCGAIFDTGNILLETRIFNGKLLQRLEEHTVTGNSLCPEHKAMVDAGYVLGMVVADGDRNKRTGELIRVRESAWPHLFNVPVPSQKLCFLDEETAAKLRAMSTEANHADS